MSHLYKALGALLTYPSPALIEALPEIAAIVARERKLSRRTKAALAALIALLRKGDLIDLQERYVELFDRGRKTALHLFEHVHGDSRERGQAMVDLQQVYAQAGYAFAAHELPDYLPAVLEFVSLQPEAASEILGDCAHIVRSIGEALAARGSAYAAVLAAVLDAIGEEGLAPQKGKRVAAAPVIDEPPLDEDWKEEQVFFGPPGGQGCGVAKPQVSVVQFVPQKTASRH